VNRARLNRCINKVWTASWVVCVCRDWLKLVKVCCYCYYNYWLSRWCHCVLTSAGVCHRDGRQTPNHVDVVCHQRGTSFLISWSTLGKLAGVTHPDSLRSWAILGLINVRVASANGSIRRRPLYAQGGVTQLWTTFRCYNFPLVTPILMFARYLCSR
jgi:hypothetical protein